MNPLPTALLPVTEHAQLLHTNICLKFAEVHDTLSWFSLELH